MMQFSETVPSISVIDASKTATLLRSSFNERFQAVDVHRMHEIDDFSSVCQFRSTSPMSVRPEEQR
jgi:hypothetical protein